VQEDKKGEDRRNTDKPRQLAMFAGSLVLVALPSRRKPKPRKQRVT
jgi:hypothetical protein